MAPSGARALRELQVSPSRATERVGNSTLGNSTSKENTYRERGSKRERKVGALKAILQTVMPDLYWHDEDGAEAFFRDSVQDDDPVALTIANELTKHEIREAFSWGERCDGSLESELGQMPVMAFLGKDQLARARVMLLATEKADSAYQIATTIPTPREAGRVGIEPRVELGERLFVNEMMVDAAAQRGVGTGPEGRLQPGGEDRDGLPEPWRTRTGKDLDRLRRADQGDAHRRRALTRAVE